MTTKPKTKKQPKIIITSLPAERISRLIADYVLDADSPEYHGRVRCSISRIPEDCAPSHWSYGVRLELVDAPDANQPKAKRGRKAKEAA